MTDRPDEADRPDETDDSIDALLSADLDGETTAAEHDRIEADPVLLTRLAELRQASELAAQAPAPLDPAQIDAAINRATAGFRPVSAVPPRRRAAFRRPRSQPKAVPWLVAAAVVLLAGIGLGLILTDQSSSTRPEAATATTAPAAQDKAAALGSSARSASRTPLRFVGRFATPAALRSGLATKLPTTPGETSTSRVPQLFPGQADRCSTVLEARDPRLVRSNRRTVAAASIAEEPVLVLEYRTRVIGGTGQTTRVIAVGAVACNDRVDFQR